MSQTVKIFIAFDRGDRPCWEKLKVYLAPLVRRGLIELHTPDSIAPGAPVEAYYKENFQGADIIILCVTELLVAHGYEQFVQPALKLHEERKTRVIPVLFRRVIFFDDIKRLALLPSDKPIADWRNKDDAFSAVLRGLERAINKTIEDKTNGH